MLTKRPSARLVTAASIAVAIALVPMPYGYYTLLRLFICGVCLYFLARVPGAGDGEKWVLGGLAVLYNPLVPVALGSKPHWTVINVGTVIYLWVLDSRASRTVRR